MRSLWTAFEWFGHGVLLGGVLGALAGGTEYHLLISGAAYAGDLTKAYWHILLSYVIVGAAAGAVVTVGIRLMRGQSQTLSHHLARVGATLIALGVFSYLAVWATYWIGLPLLKLSHLIAYVVALSIAVGIGTLLYQLSKVLLVWMDKRESSLRVGIPLILSFGIVFVLLVPLLLFDSTGSAQRVALPSSIRSVQGTRPNVVFILIDTLRADHLPMYGYSRQTAPNLSVFAQRGKTFTHMYAQSSFTRPSVATIFSSLYPSVHKTNLNENFLSGSIVTLAEVLREAGYQTLGVSANVNVSPTFGFSQGFDEFSASRSGTPLRFTMLGRVAANMFMGRTRLLPKKREEISPEGQDITNVAPQRISKSVNRLKRLVKQQASFFFHEREEELAPRAEIITNVALQLASQRGKEPCFLYVHYLDPHSPYNPPSPFDQAFNYRNTPSIHNGGINPVRLISNEADQERTSVILDQYDGEILYTDQQVGRLLEGLKELGMLENALVIITADHGEEFLDHGETGHGKTLYEEVLHVPFLLSWPGQIPAGAEYEKMVGLIDVMPTLLSLLGIPPPPGLQGISFATQLTQPYETEPGKKMFAQLMTDNMTVEMVRQQQQKFIRHVQGLHQGLEELYDLEQDPLERTNLAVQNQSQMAVWREELDTFLTAVTQAESQISQERVDLDKDTERTLRALGYIK